MSSFSASLARDVQTANTLKFVSATISALQIWFRETWSQYSRNELAIATTTSVQDIKQFAYENSKTTYPLAILAPAGFQPNPDKSWLRHRFTPIIGAKDYNRKLAKKYTMTPVLAGYGMQFRTNDVEEANLFATMVYLTAPGPSLVLQSNSGFAVQSRVSFPSDLDITPNSDPNSYFSIDMSIVFSTWLGIVEDTGLIDNLKFQYRLFDKSAEFEITYDADLQTYLPPIEITQKSSYTDAFDKNSPNYASSKQDITGV